ncbi:MAG TPA: D-2-hydroxyacid dehydrogenase [Leucothrix sp.]|nr:D-2-hydroxyacid dehydrogenase [Leucothrix sp.]
MNNSKHLNAVILDEESFNPGDLDLSKLIALLDNWERYPSTKPEQREKRLAGKQIAIANKVVFDVPLLKNLPELKVILLTATGMDNIDRDYCQQHGIATYNVTDYCTATVSQHVFALILALKTQLIPYQTMTKNGDWSRSGQFSSLAYPISELAGKTLGLVGYGNLAKGVETLAKAFGMKILIAQRAGSSEASDGRLLLHDLLPQVDVLSIHCPLMPETKNLISTKEFELMKSSAVIINTARGAVIDKFALAKALKDQEIAGAGIDVLDQEPPPLDHPLLDEKVPNLILTPHIAWAAVEARQRVIDKVAENLGHWLRKV